MWGWLRCTPFMALSVFAYADVISTNVPAGFEEFDQSQTTAVDIFYGGDYLGSQFVSYDTSTLTFSNPDDVLSLIRHLKRSEEVRRVLETELDTHSEALCYLQTQRDCGVIEPDVVGIIFNENLFRVDLFINPDYLDTQVVERQRYLPMPKKQWGFLQNLYANSATQSGDGTNYSIFGNTYLSHGARRGVSDWSKSAEGTFTLDKLAYEEDMRKWFVQAGVLSTYGSFFTFIPSESLIGGRGVTNFNVRTDLDSARSSTIRVFLPNRAQVNLSKDNRLYSSQYYPAGNQEIDTSRLPDGAYDLTIEIKETGGRITTQTQFFVKNSVLPPFDTDEWYLEAGDLRRASNDQVLPESLGTTSLRVGHNKRMLDDVYWKNGLAVTTNEALWETQSGWFKHAFDLTGRAMTSSSGDTGFGFEYFYRWRELSASVTWNEVYAADDKDPEDYHMIPGDRSNTVVNLGHPMLGGVGRVQYTKVSGTSNQETISFLYNRSLWRSSHHHLLMDMEVTQDDGLNTYLVGVDYQFDSQPWRHALHSAVVTEEEAEAERENNVRAIWNGSWTPERAPLGDYMQVRANSQKQGEDSLVGAGFDLDGHYGHMDAQVERSEQTEQSSTSMSLRGQTTFAMNADASGFGGYQNGRSAILIKLDGEEGTSVRVNLDRDYIGDSQVGETSVVLVPAYKEYSVQLVDSGFELVKLDQPNAKLVTYPGNVLTMTSKAGRVKILMGRVVWEECQAGKGCAWVPIGAARLDGEFGWSTSDSGGYFQLEVTQDELEAVAYTKNRQCSFKLVVPVDNDNNDSSSNNNNDSKENLKVHWLGDVRCEHAKASPATFSRDVGFFYPDDPQEYVVVSSAPHSSTDLTAKTSVLTRDSSLSEVKKHYSDAVSALFNRSADVAEQWQKLPPAQRTALVEKFHDSVKKFEQQLGGLSDQALASTDASKVISFCDFAINLITDIYTSILNSEYSVRAAQPAWSPSLPGGVFMALDLPTVVWSLNAALAVVCGGNVV